MTAKEYLSQAYRLDKRIDSKIEQIKSLNLLAQNARLHYRICQKVKVPVTLDLRIPL